MNQVDIRLYAILGPGDTRGRDLAQCAAAAVAGGATVIQYRDKQSEGRDLVANARAIKRAIAGSGASLLINDRIDVALAAEADGVHLGQNDIAPEDARRLLGPDAIIGLTLKMTDHARALEGQPIDYSCIGGVFATTSKDNPDPPVGLDGLARIEAIARTALPGAPVGAIAGIGLREIPAVIGAGADGVAVISAIFGHDDIEKAARILRDAIDRALAARGA
ncbi:MAG: thiamine phosphate synthase [Salinarimonadaceae bacterium]|nr:MAG: thiamine phosphate synthase [Salinarimonadaceae bacterium]